MKKIKKSILILGGLLYSMQVLSQIGINTLTPKATFDITAKSNTGTTTIPEGWLIPRVDRARAKAMTAIEISTLVYINDASTGVKDGAVINIDSTGYYYFDGRVWVKFSTKNDLDTSLYTVGGTLTSNRVITQDANKLSFKGTAKNTFSVNGPTFSVDAEDHKVGFGTDNPQFPMDILTGRYGMRHTDKSVELRTFLGSNIDNGNKQAGWFGTKSTHALDFMTGDQPRMTIDPEGKVGIGAQIPAASAQLELASTSKGFLPPRMTEAQRNTISPLIGGLTIFNTDKKCMQYWNETAWKGNCADPTPPSPDLSINCKGWMIPYKANNGTVSGTVNGKTITAKFSDYKNITPRTSASAQCGVSANIPASFTFSNIEGAGNGHMKIKFNQKVSNIKFYAVAMNYPEQFRYKLYNNGKLVTPVVTTIAACKYIVSVPGGIVTGMPGGGGSPTLEPRAIALNVGGVWFDEIVIDHLNMSYGDMYNFGAIMNFCVGSAQ